MQGDAVRNIRLTLEYDGSAFHGWQIQKNGVSVQETLAIAISAITGEQAMPTGAGRTDAGVHAYGQVAAFQTESRISAEKFADALNAGGVVNEPFAKQFLRDENGVAVVKCARQFFHGGRLMQFPV